MRHRSVQPVGNDRTFLPWVLALALAGCNTITPTGAKGGHPASHGPSPVASASSGPVTVAGSPAPKGSPAATPPVSSPSPALVVPSPAAVGLVGRVLVPATIVSDLGSAVIANNGGSVIANNGGNIVANNGGGIVANNDGGFRLLDVSAAAYAGAEVDLVDAGGKPVLDAAGKPVKTTTDASGNYTLPFTGNPSNLIVKVTLPANHGDLVALVPKGKLDKATTVDMDLTSTLVVGYILDRFVAGQADRQKVLDKLPPDVEADTRAKTAAAIASTHYQPPKTVTEAAVVTTVEDLRKQDTTVDKQLDYVKSLLLAGLSNQGAGLPARSVATDAVDLALGPHGEIYYAEHTSARVWTLDAQGLLQPVAGTGESDLAAYRNGASAQPAPGDGGPALAATMQPTAIAADAQGNLYIADLSHVRIRRVTPDGKIDTLLSHADFINIRKMVCLADGSLLVATDGFIDRVGPDKTVTRVAGLDSAPIGAASLGDGGPAAQARFIGISGLCVEPASGDILIYDHARVRRISGGVINTVVGSGASGFGGDGGPATQARLQLSGGVGFDAQGRLLVGDETNYRLRRVENGTITTIAGSGDQGLSGDGGPPLAAQMLGPKALATASDGTIYMVDDGVVRTLKDGTLETVIGKVDDVSGPRPADQVNIYPNDLAYDAATNSVLFTDWSHIRRLDLAANTVENISGTTVGQPAFSEGQAPLAAYLGGFGNMLLQPDGSLILSSVVGGSDRILLQKDGALTTLAGATMHGGSDWSQFYVDGPARTVAIWALPYLAQDGNTLYVESEPPTFLGPDALAQPPIIRKLSLGGNITHLAGGGSATADGSPMADFKFTYLYAMVLDPERKNLYVSDIGTIWRIDLTDGTVHRYAGTGDPGDSVNGQRADLTQVYVSRGMAFDQNGNLYYSEFASGTVRKIDAKTHILTTIAGKGSPNLSGNTVDDSLSGPWGIVFDPAGNLYIADRDHGQIKKVPADKL